MAETYTFGFSNTTTADPNFTSRYALGAATNYGIDSDTGTETVLVNATATADMKEIVKYRSRKIERLNTDLDIFNPTPASAPVQYGIVSECVVRHTLNDGTIYDEPVVITSSIRGNSPMVSRDDIMDELMRRHVSFYYKDDGTPRFKSMALGVERPTAD